MGLDWIIDPKPKPGFEDEFEIIKKELNQLENEEYCLGCNSDIKNRLNELNARFGDISISPIKTSSQFGNEYDTKMRGKIIARADFFSENLQNSCYSHMNPDYMVKLSNMIDIELKFANITDEKKEIYMLVVDWLRFWSGQGHGLTVWW